MSLIAGIKRRAEQQAQATIETHDGKVTQVYADSVGNITHADVILEGQVNPLIRVPNASGLKVASGGNVKINYSKGSRLNPQVIGVSGAASGTVISAAASATVQAALASTAQSDTSTSRYLLPEPDDNLPNGLTLTAGANVSLSESTNAGGGILTLGAAPMAGTTLPSGTGLPAGTLFDLSDAGGNAAGMFRWDGTAWQRRDGATSSQIAEAVQSPFWRARAWNNAGSYGRDTHLDASYFTGSNLPTGAQVYDFDWDCQGRGGTFWLWSSLSPFALWIRMGIKNNSASAQTMHYHLPYIDNADHILWKGATLIDFADSDLVSASGSIPNANYSADFSIAAGDSGILEIFFYNEASSGGDAPANPGTFTFVTSVFNQPGMAWYDAGA